MFSFWLVGCLALLFGAPAASAMQCFSCASKILESNWEVTGLDFNVDNETFFRTENDCYFTKGAPRVNCEIGCFFATYALDNLYYAAVRGCIEDFSNNGVVGANDKCNFARSPNVVIVEEQIAQSPLIGWYMCFGEDSCNNMIVDYELATKPARWYVYNKPCEEPNSSGTCLSCQEFDGSGKCSHRAKSTCMGNYCTTITGKVNGRRFEKRGCAPLDPLDLQTCKEVKHDLVIEQFSGTLRQSYHSKTCVCRGDRCNSEKVV